MLTYLWIFISLVRYAHLYSYFCNFKCGKRHTVCQRQPCGPGYKCGPNYKMLQMDDESRQWALDAHNELRNKIALGQDTRGGNGEAANMNSVSYSREIEFVAQCWANNCGSNGFHDKCRSTREFASVGQNMYAVGGTGKWNFSEQKYVVDGTKSWYGEIKHMQGYVIDKFQSISGKQIGHFTQLLWAKTTFIGCGRTQYGFGKNRKMILYCNYGEGGNVMGASVYQRGEPCSKCGSKGCNSKYKGLCGEIRSLKADKWMPPFNMGGSRLQSSSNNIITLILMYVIMIKI